MQYWESRKKYRESRKVPDYNIWGFEFNLGDNYVYHVSRRQKRVALKDQCLEERELDSGNQKGNRMFTYFQPSMLPIRAIQL